jgi:signal transduction histidine kinase
MLSDHVEAAAIVIVIVIAESALLAGLLVVRRGRQDADKQIRYLGGRLLRAYEEERGRIARELHDDIIQQIALLSLDIELLQTAPPEDFDRMVRESMARTNDLAVSVRNLSQRLHPPRLKQLGLVAALAQLQHELSHYGLTIDFAEEGVTPKLAPDIALCVFRIAQEALHNAVKHGRASRASMRLSANESFIALSVVDNGSGFDVDQAHAGGLGLISIRERLDLVGGTLHIRSSRRDGTSIFITIPLPSADKGGAV